MRDERTMRPDPEGPLRLVVVGVGFWGRSWLDVVRQSPHWEIAALADADPSALDRAATAAAVDRAACFESLTDAAAVESDAVLVAVPPAAHAPIALEALGLGLHCLVEKPFASTLSDARKMVEHAESSSRVMMVSQQYRHRPGARTVARLIEAGAVGRVGATQVTFAHELAARGFQHEMDEPLLLDMAIHHFDLLRGVLGIEPTRVQAASWNPSWSSFAGNASATVVFEDERGTAVTYTGTLEPRGVETHWDGSWTILCDEGTIRWNGDDVVVRPLARPLLAKIRSRALKRAWRGRKIKPTHVPAPDRLGSLAEFSAAIREQREPETSGRDNIRSLALTLAAVESTQRRTAVDVREPTA